MLAKVSGFSLALNVSTFHSSSYLHVRIRFKLNDIIHKYHLLSIPFYEWHPAEDIFSVLVKYLDELHPSWKDYLIGCSTDGARSMAGIICGLATSLSECSTDSLIRIWCGLHQLDVVMQDVFKSSFDENFHSKLTALIDYVRRQQNLISMMAFNVSYGIGRSVGVNEYMFNLASNQHYSRAKIFKWEAVFLHAWHYNVINLICNSYYCKRIEISVWCSSGIDNATIPAESEVVWSD